MSIEKINNGMGVSIAKNDGEKKITRNRVYLNVPKDSVNFTGAATVATKSVEEMILDLMSKPIKVLVKMFKSMGEIQNQLINAIGTGFIAPLFIKYNPFSDTDENKRTYSAWRQPISAVLAVLTQTAIVIPFNSAIKKAADTGFFSTQYNTSLFPSEDYIKAMIKAENPTVKYTKEELAKAVKDKEKELATNLEDMIKDNKIEFYTSDGGTVKMPDAEFKALFTETIDDIIKEEDKEISKAFQTKFPKKVERGIFYKEHPTEAKDILTRLQTKVGDIINSTGTDDSAQLKPNKEFNKECKDIIKELKQEMKKDPSKTGINETLIKIVKEVKEKNIGSSQVALNTLNSKLGNMIDNVDKMSQFTNTEELADYIQEAIHKRVNGIEGTISTLKEIKEKLRTGTITVQEAQDIIDNAIQKSENTVTEALEKSGITGDDIKRTPEWIESTASRLKEKAKSVAKCIGEQEKRHVKANIDGLKRWTGLGVSLAILPVTCKLLNKIYPIIMNKFFSELTTPKEGGNE